ncbi:MAG TPA: oligosaccharide flippase family protein [Burkholderiaceae bacterium]|jgi:O-antigen/teichoic acid export membrane protein
MLRNALNNLAGALIPALIMFVTVPIFIRGLGQADYGLFVIVTSIAGYLAVLDINVTASSVKFVAESRALGDHARVGQVVGFGLAFYALIGVVGAVLQFVFAVPLTKWLAESPGNADMIHVLRVSAIGFLLAQLYSFGLSIPQALERYDISSGIEILNGVAVPTVIALLVLAGGHLAGVMWLRNALAAVSVLMLFWLIRRLLPHVGIAWPQKALRRELLSFSAYTYLSRLASLSYQHSDKLVIAAVLGVPQVALYSVPVVLANRVLGMTFRLTQVIFPTSSALLAKGAHVEVRELMLLSMRYVGVLNVMAVVGLALIGRWFLTAWLGPEFADKGTAVLIMIAIGTLVDSVTNAPSLVTDGSGRPAVTGFFSAGRAVVGLAAIFVGARWGGIEGVAASHLVVSIFSAAVFLAYFGKRVIRIEAAVWWQHALAPAALVAVVGMVVGEALVLLLSPASAWAHPVAAVAAEMVMLVVFWRHTLLPEHRARVRRRIFATTDAG